LSKRAKRGGQSAIKLDILIPRPHLSTKSGQVHFVVQ
jgi:hypothetical protein